MVTRNSGTATPMVALQLNSGVVHTGSAKTCEVSTPAKLSCPCASATATPTSSTPGTA